MYCYTQFDSLNNKSLPHKPFCPAGYAKRPVETSLEGITIDSGTALFQTSFCHGYVTRGVGEGGERTRIQAMWQKEMWPG